MNHKLFVPVLIAVLALVVSACGEIPTLIATPSPIPTSTATPSPTIKPTPTTPSPGKLTISHNAGQVSFPIKGKQAQRLVVVHLYNEKIDEQQLKVIFEASLFLGRGMLGDQIIKKECSFNEIERKECFERFSVGKDADAIELTITVINENEIEVQFPLDKVEPPF